LSLDPTSLAQGVLAGQRRALARAITLIESTRPDHREAAEALLHQLLPHTGRSVRIGITGVPGAGKSTFIEAFGLHVVDKGHRLAVLAVDPSSPRSGGSILGDKTRMEELSRDERAFIRPSPSGCTLGGVARRTREAMLVCEAAGFDVIVVETVGVGQDEIDIVKLAEVSIVVLVPGMGDDIQALKAGIMEIGDIFVINKCDHPGVEKMERAVLAMLSLAHREDGWQPPIVKTVATEGEGVEELATTIDKAYSFFESSPQKAGKKQDAARQRLITLLQERLVSTVMQRVFADGELDKIIEQITNRQQDPYTIVDEIVRNSELKRYK